MDYARKLMIEKNVTQKYWREVVFGSKFNILKDARNGKFDAKSDKGISLGYSTRSKAYKCLNTNTTKLWKVQM